MKKKEIASILIDASTALDTDLDIKIGMVRECDTEKINEAIAKAYETGAAIAMSACALMFAGAIKNADADNLKQVILEACPIEITPCECDR